MGEMFTGKSSARLCEGMLDGIQDMARFEQLAKAAFKVLRSHAATIYTNIEHAHRHREQVREGREAAACTVLLPDECAFASLWARARVCVRTFLRPSTLSHIFLRAAAGRARPV